MRRIATSMCSTPFGVTDLVTRRSIRRCRARCRAQRLSASQTWSLPAPIAVPGSIGGAQRLSASQTWSHGEAVPVGRPVRVLNAFRRHRLGHAVDAGAIRRRVRCAQRLSASQTWSPRSPASPARKSASAQRLSASQTWSRPAATEVHASVSPVLNAFRRHRLGHSIGPPGGSSSAWCSTPFGVTDLVTRAAAVPAACGDGAQRLSASQTWSRRIRPHSAPATRGAQRLSASQTWSRRGASRILGARGSAQRLSASQTWSRDPRSHDDRHPGRAQRLSASQTWSPQGDRLRKPASSGAQRLSASQTWSRVREPRTESALFVLNAFRRHRLGHRRGHALC